MLVTFKLLQLVAKTFIADDKNSLSNIWNLQGTNSNAII